jgi:hypothetical protein
MRLRALTGTRAAVTAAALACASLGIVTTTAGSALAVQVRNNTPWSILLCKFAMDPAEPQPPSFFANLLTDAGVGMGGVADYFNDQSNGLITLAGSEVKGWYTEPYTLDQDKALGGDRGTRILHCVNTAASAGYTVPAGNHVLVILNDQVDGGEWSGLGGSVVLDPPGWTVGEAAHEMLHAYGLEHSFSNDTSVQFKDAAPGEYDDPWDEMSALNIYTFQTASFGQSAVGLAGYQRDKLGWLPISRVVTMGGDGSASQTFTLAPINAQSAPGTLLVRVPFDPGDLNHYYTVEYQRQTGWSQGIPGDTVLIHEVQGGKPTLLRDLSTAARSPVQSLTANGVQITVDSISGDAATVTVSTGIVNQCVQGYVWREANPSDHVCVTTDERSQVAADNAAAPSRWVNGAYGPHTCVNGYVWREAFTSPTFDDVCVTTGQRDQAAADNAAAADRINPAHLVFGPNTCQNGYVWREADDYDYTCVTPDERSQVVADNAAAPSRWVNGAYGPHTCIDGYVWREAFHYPSLDDVCVTTGQRDQAAADNAAASSRVQSPNG